MENKFPEDIHVVACHHDFLLLPLVKGNRTIPFWVKEDFKHSVVHFIVGKEPLINPPLIYDLHLIFLDALTPLQIQEIEYPPPSSPKAESLPRGKRRQAVGRSS